MRTVDISQLMIDAGIDFKGHIQLDGNMSSLEPNPKDDWLYLCLLSFKKISVENQLIRSIALIGSGNGIDAIAALKLFPNLNKLYVTDVLPEVLPHIQRNIEDNFPEEARKVEIVYLIGRDAEPIPEEVDFIYANLPLITVDLEELQTEFSTTTLTDARRYAHLSYGVSDNLKKYSLLSQLGFLLSAKDKLSPTGFLVTLIGGRIPTSVIDECFARAGFKDQRTCIAFMSQSDPQFLKQYAIHEKVHGISFSFYDYGKAATLLKLATGVSVPDVLNGCEEMEVRNILKDAEITAVQAYDFYNKGKDVGHLAYVFEARIL